MSSLLLPNGLKPRRGIEVTPLEMDWFELGDEMCRKLGVTIACARCIGAGEKLKSVFQGNNSTTDAVLTVSCNCRTLTLRRKSD